MSELVWNEEQELAGHGAAKRRGTEPARSLGPHWPLLSPGAAVSSIRDPLCSHHHPHPLQLQ